MLIDCPNCTRSYHVGRDEIGETGRAVVCPRCNTGWYVAGSAPKVEPPRTVPARHSLDLSAAGARGPGLLRRTAPAIGALACLAAAMGGIAAREHVVRLAPRTAGIYAAAGMPVNVVGLDLGAITTTRSDAASGDVTISGTIRNVAARRVAVPRLSFEARDAGGRPVAAWTEAAPAKTLAAGRLLAFAATPHAVPAEARTVLVSFAAADPATALLRISRRQD